MFVCSLTCPLKFTEFGSTTKQDFTLGISLLLPKQQQQVAYCFLNVLVTDKTLG